MCASSPMPSRTASKGRGCAASIARACASDAAGSPSGTVRLRRRSPSSGMVPCSRCSPATPAKAAARPRRLLAGCVSGTQRSSVGISVVRRQSRAAPASSAYAGQGVRPPASASVARPPSARPACGALERAHASDRRRPAMLVQLKPSPRPHHSRRGRGARPVPPGPGPSASGYAARIPRGYLADRIPRPAASVSSRARTGCRCR